MFLDELFLNSMLLVDKFLKKELMSLNSKLLPSMHEMLSIIKNGLHKSNSPKNIVILGAGISGLVTASLLKDAGHQITILEWTNLYEKGTFYK